MEIGTNELTRPFRIPRKKGSKNDDEKGNPKSGANESVQRSPLANAVTPRKNEASFSNRIVPPTKRKASQEIRAVSAKKSAVKAPSGGDVFDKIIVNMVNPPKEKKPETPKEREELPGPSGANSSKNTGGNVRRLTKEELDRQVFDNSACYAFLRKEGLMERLLGHKMLTGRVDSYLTLGYLPLDPGEQTYGRKANYNCSSSFDDFPTICEPAPVAVAAEERRGPRTPPGSPGRQDNSSMVSSRGAGSATQSSHPPPPPPPLPPDEEQKRKDTSPKADGRKTDEGATTSLAVMSELEKCSHNQLAEFLVGELQNAMKQVDHKILLSTLKDALMKVGKKNEQNESEKVSPSAKKEESGNELLMNPPVEMDIESDHSAAGEESVLPPPPPVPRTPPPLTSSLAGTIGTTLTPVMPPPPCILPTPPPPPPLVLQAAPPPPVILRPPPPQAVIVQPTIPASIILQPAPPAPVLSQPQLQPPVAEATVHFTWQQPATNTTSLSTALPSSFAQPPPLQRAIEKSLQSSSGVNTDLRTTSPLFSTSNIAMSFTAPPPPMIVNTAVPPPNYNNSQPLRHLQSSCPTSEGSSTLRMQSSVNSQMQNSILASTSNVISSAGFPGPKPPIVQVLHPPSTENASPRPPMNPSHIDFTKPPPTPLSSSNQRPSTSASLLPPASPFSLATGTARLPSPAVDVTNSNIRLSNSSDTNQMQNMAFGKNVSLPAKQSPEISSSLSMFSNNANQNVQSSSGQKSHFTQSSVNLNSKTNSVSIPLSHQNSLSQVGTVSSTPTSETVIKTLLNALAIPQKSQQVQQQPQNQPIRTTLNSVQSPHGSHVMKSQNRSVNVLDRFGKSPARTQVTDNVKPIPTVGQGSTDKNNTLSEDAKETPPKSETPVVKKEQEAENGVKRVESANDCDKQSTTVNKNEPPKEVKFFRHVKEIPLHEKPITFFGSPAPSSKRPGQPPVPPPLTAPPVPRSRLDGPANMHDKPMPHVPPGFMPHLPLRPRFPPVPMPFRMRGPYPFPLRRPPPPFPPGAPGFRMLRPRFNR